MRKKGFLLTIILLVAVCLNSLALAAPSTAQEDRTLTNLVAYTKLIGYVRYFHPADAAADINWDLLTHNNVQAVLEAETDADLIDTLNSIITPYAPTVQVFASGQAPPLPDALQIADSADGVIQWFHLSFSNLSVTERFVVPLEDGVLPPSYDYALSAPLYESISPITISVHDPAQPPTLRLTDTVEARIPFALYVVDDATQPVGEAPDIQYTNITPDTFAGRATDIIYLWNHFQHFFPYWDILEEQFSVDWETVLMQTLTATLEDETLQDFYFTLRSMIAHLHDGHGNVFMPLNADVELYSGYTLPFTWAMVEGQLTVTTLLERNTQGIKVGDVITEIDGQPVSELLEEWQTITSPFGDYGTYRILEEWSLTFESPQLTVQPADGGETTIIEIEARSSAQSSNVNHREERPAVIARLGSGILYIDLTRLNTGRYEAAINLMQEAEGIIFDIRGYPEGTANILLGHLRDVNLNSAPFLLPVVISPDHEDILFIDFSDPNFIYAQASLVTDNVTFITNSNGTVSYGESIISIVEGHELGPIVGSHTAGANGNVRVLETPGDFTILYTSIQSLQFDGSQLYTVGVAPTHPVERTREGVIAGRDELLEAAFAIVGGTDLEILNCIPMSNCQ